MLDSKIQCSQSEIEQKLNQMFQIADTQISSLTQQIDSVKQVQSEKNICMEQEILKINTALIQSDEKHSLCEADMLSKVEKLAFCLDELEKKLRSEIDNTNKIIENAQQKSSEELLVLGETITKEFSSFTRETEDKILDLRQKIQAEADINKIAFESTKAEFLNEIQLVNSAIDNTKADSMLRLSALADKVAADQESGIRSLEQRMIAVQDEMQTQVTTNKASIEATTLSLQSSFAAATEMCQTVKSESADKILSIACEIREELKLATNGLDEHLSRFENDFKRHEEETKALFEESKASIALTGNRAEELVRAAQSENAKEVASLGEFFGNELASTIQDVDAKFSLVHGQLQKQIENSQAAMEQAEAKILDLRQKIQAEADINKIAFESTKAEFLNEIQLVNSAIDNTKADSMLRLSALADKVAADQESGIRSLEQRMIAVQDEMQTQVTTNKASIEATTLSLQSSFAAATEMCQTVKSESADKILSIACEIREELKLATNGLDEHLSRFENDFKRHEEETKALFEESKASIALTGNRAEELVRAAQSENAKEVASLGEFFGNELASTIQDVDAKFSLVHGQLQKQIENSEAALNTVKSEINASVTLSRDALDNLSSRLNGVFENLGRDIRAEQSSALKSIDEKVFSIQGELQLQIQENHTLIEGLKCEFENSQHEARSAVQETKSKISEDILSLTSSIQREQQAAISDLRQEIAGTTVEARSSNAELLNLIRKTDADLAAASENLEKLVYSSSAEVDRTVSLLSESIAKEIAQVSANAKSGLLQVDEKLQAHIVFCKSTFESNQSKFGEIEQCAYSRLESATSEIKAYTESLLEKLRSEKLSEDQSLEQRLRSTIDEQKTAVRALDEKLTTSLDELRLQDSMTTSALTEEKARILEVQESCFEMITSAKSDTKKDTDRLEETLSGCKSAQESFIQQLSSIRSELQLQIDENRELIEEAATGAAAANTATLQLIQESKIECSTEAKVASDALRTELANDLLLLKDSSTSSTSNAQIIIETHRNECKSFRESLQNELQILKDKLEEFKAGSFLEIELLRNNIRTELQTNYHELTELLFQSKQEMQAQVDLTLLANNETMESSKGGLFEMHKLVTDSIAGVKAEWKSDISQCCEQTNLRSATIKEDLDEKIRILQRESNSIVEETNLKMGTLHADFLSLKADTQSALDLRLSEVMSVVQNSTSSFDARADALSARVTQVEESVLQGARSAAMLSSKISEMQEQHAFCLTDIMQDKQELSEIQLTLGQIRTDIAEYNCQHSNLRAEVSRVDAEAKIVQENVAEFRSRISSIAEHKASQKNENEELTAASANAGNQFSAQFTAIEITVQDLRSTCLDGLEKLAAEILQLKTTKDRDDTTIQTKVTDLQESIAFLQAAQDSFQIDKCALDSIVHELPTSCFVCLDCLEKLSAIVSATIPRLDSLLSEMTSMKNSMKQEVNGWENYQQESMLEVEQMRKTVNEVQAQHLSSLSEMMGDRQELSETQLAVRQLQTALGETKARIEELDRDWDKLKNRQVQNGDLVNIQGVELSRNAISTESLVKTPVLGNEMQSPESNQCPSDLRKLMQDMTFDGLRQACIADLRLCLAAMITDEVALVRKHVSEASTQALDELSGQISLLSQKLQTLQIGTTKLENHIDFEVQKKEEKTDQEQSRAAYPGMMNKAALSLYLANHLFARIRDLSVSVPRTKI